MTTRPKPRLTQRQKPAASRPQISDRFRSPKSPLHIKTLVYGPPRVGKTVFVGSAGNDPRTAPLLLLDFEGGSSSLQGTTADVSILPIRDWQDYNEVYAYLAEGKHEFQSVAIDSVSETHIYSLIKIVEAQVQGSDRRKDDLQTEQGDYGKSMMQMQKFLRAFRDLPLHVFLTAHTKTELEPGEGWVRKPKLYGQLSDEIVGMFDITTFMMILDEDDEDAANKRRKARRTKSSKSDAADRVLLLANEPKIRLGIRRPMDVEIPDSIRIGLHDGVTQLFDALGIKGGPRQE